MFFKNKHQINTAIYITKKARNYAGLDTTGAEGRTRTGTWVTTSDFESGASANSATSAYRRSLLLLTNDILTKSVNEVKSQIDFAKREKSMI